MYFENERYINTLTFTLSFTFISGHPSAAGRAQDSESSSVRDRRPTTVPPLTRALHTVIKRQFLKFIFAIFLLNLLYTFRQMLPAIPAAGL